MTAAATPVSDRWLLRGAEVWLAFSVITVIALLVLPLPPSILDALLATSIGLSIIVLLVALNCGDPLDFSVFPSLLLLLTLYRLGLNVNSTRLILGQADAGSVIDAFGNAVIGGNYVVGLVIFMILVVINFMVITKGASRIAEVAARFTLDAMPGRQMSIDADLSAGMIDEAEARQRRSEINRYADFYGAMDGAAKFVRGDAIAGLVITGINLIGGFVIGMAQRGLGPADALATYSRLTVGDGLVTQIPALIVSTAAGIIVTYGSGQSKVAPAILIQVANQPRAIWVAAGILGSIGLVPGFPMFPFLLLGATAAGFATLAQRRERARREESQAAVQTETKSSEPQPLQDLLRVEPLELEVGYALVPLVDEEQRGDLLQRVQLMRKQVALDLGLIVPPVRIRDNIQLPSAEYRIRLRGVEVARGEIMSRYLLALNTSGDADPIDGIQTTDPSFGIPAVWIATERRVEAEAAGYRVVEPATVLATHLMETIKRHAADLLGRQETKELLDALKQQHEALVEDVVPNKVSLGLLHRVLQRLLREGVPIRNLVTILETLSDSTEQTKDPEVLTEQVRHALGKVIARQFQEGDGTIRGIAVGPRLETALMSLFSPRPKSETGLSLSPDDITEVMRALHEMVKTHSKEGQRRPLLTPSTLRIGVRRLIEPVIPNLPVISLGELPVETPVQSIATWELPRVA